MKAILRFIAANNFLPIAVTFVCFQFFSKYYTLKVDYFLCLLATLGTWFIYLYDKIIDNKNRYLHPNQRHSLTPLDIKTQSILGVILSGLCMYYFHSFTIGQLYIYASILPIIGFYFFLHKKATFLTKEILSTLIITIVVTLYPLLTNTIKIQVLLHLSFFIMVFSNMILLSISDYEIDKTNSYLSMSIYLGIIKTKAIFIILLLLLLAISLFLSSSIFKLWIISYIALYIALLLIIIKNNADKNLIHILADSIFLMPLLF